jgi:beta-galactosidase
VVTFRTGYADEHGRARTRRAPGPLREAAGVSYQEYVNLAAPVPVVPAAPDSPATPRAGAPLTVPAGSTGQHWADGLQLEGATALAWYDHPHLGRFPAITTHEYGRGRVTYLGTLPSPELGAALARWLAAVSGLQPSWPGLPDAVRVDGARTRSGQRIWFVGNWSWQPTAITVPHPMRDLLGGAELAAGEELTLGAWDIRLTQQLT